MKFVNNRATVWLIAMLVVAAIAAMVALCNNIFDSEEREALMLWAVVLSALYSFMLVLAVVYEGERVITVVKKDESADNSCACSKDRKE